MTNQELLQGVQAISSQFQVPMATAWEIYLQQNRQKEKLWKNYFAFTFQVTALSANGTITPSSTVGGEPLEVKLITLSLTSTANSPIITIQIQQSRNSENWFLYPIESSAINGNGQLPFYLPVSRYLSPNETVTFTITEVVGGTGNVQIVLHCNKILGSVSNS